MNGTYKLTNDFNINPGWPQKIVRDINFQPSDSRLPDIAICRVFSSRDDAVLILESLRTERSSPCY